MYNTISPFSNLHVSISDIDYDFDGMDDEDIEVVKTRLPLGGELDFTSEELFGLGILRENHKGGDWTLDIDALEEYLGELITDNTEMCHNNFTFRYSVSP